jgi:CBS domain-containing protein
MKTKIVRDVMIHLSDYCTVSENDTLSTAIKTLKACRNDPKFSFKHRAVLAYDKNKKITGKISIFDMLKALEPKYRHFEHPENIGSIGLSRFGLSQEFLNSLVSSFNLWDESFEDLVKKASKIKVKEIMYTPSQGEYVDADAPLAEAIHQFILGYHQSLLVLEKEQVVGVIRLVELFDLICDIVK